MNSNKKPLIIGIIVIILVVIGVLFFNKSGKSSLKDDPNSPDAQAEMKELVSKIGNLIDLPTGENPTVATITDPEKLKDQPFFANAKSGYKVLIYPNARKAFLYDPSRDKLVEVAPLILGNPSRLSETSNPAVSK